MSLRVVAGSARGQRLAAPPGTTTRPTTDRVRESMFNALASLDAIGGSVVLDLFAGSGALAIEALSRGAARAVLVERDARARAVTESNLQVARMVERATLLAGDARTQLSRSGESFDLVLLDPPYGYDEWDALLVALVPRLAASAVVVVESSAPVPLPPPLGVVREKRYGSTVVTFASLLPNNAAQAGDNE